ncbi:MAG: hypothetical protein HYZ75_15735 [Elusimicrobia bacterium]|nr:hypothetical protein [Elusimicrobiota bacterium]
MKTALLCLALSAPAAAQDLNLPAGPAAALGQARQAAADTPPVQGAERVTIPSFSFLKLMGYPDDITGRWNRPVAILYHTQEHASNRENAGGRYDYVDRDARNWVQFLGPEGRIVNAREYERRTYPEGREWDRYRVRSSTTSPFTIHYAMLDDERLGIDRGYGIDFNRGPNKPAHRMISFNRTDCANVPRPLGEDDGVLEIFLPAQRGAERERVCLLLTT